MSKERDEHLALEEPRPNPNEVSKPLQGQYQSVYSGLAGISVLADQLRGMGLFSMQNSNTEQAAEHNCAINLLCRAGILKLDATGNVSQKDMESIVNALLNLVR